MALSISRIILYYHYFKARQPHSCNRFSLIKKNTPFQHFYTLLHRLSIYYKITTSFSNTLFIFQYIYFSIKFIIVFILFYLSSSISFKERICKQLVLQVWFFKSRYSGWFYKFSRICSFQISSQSEL